MMSLAVQTQMAALQAIYEGQEAKLTVQQAQQAGVLRGIVSAVDLAAADIVLTTYDVLRKDVHRQADPRQSERLLRRPKRFQVGLDLVTSSVHVNL